MPQDMEEICLKHDNGKDMRFHGRLFSECSHFDEGKDCLTRQQLYITDKGDQVYYIVRNCPGKRERRAYQLAVNNDSCIIDNGAFQVTLDFDMLMLAVRGLCGLGEDETPTLESVEELLKAANS